MKSLATCLAASALIASLFGCASNEQSGQVVGGVLGGVLGSQVGGGRGRTAATVAGTIAGAMIGGSVGKSMDETDRLKAQHAFESNRTNQPSAWQNPDTGNEYTVTPTRTYVAQQSGETCREYTSEAIIGGKTETVYGTACRQSDGSWKVIQ